MTYFQYSGKFYEMVDGVCMGSPLSPVIPNFNMEKFEQQAISTAPLNLTTPLLHGQHLFSLEPRKEKLVSFPAHLNSVHPRSSSPWKEKWTVSYLDVLVPRRADGSLAHKLYRNPTHTDRYLHKLSNHPRQKQAVLKTLVDHAKRICEPWYLHEELWYLEQVLQANGYSVGEVRCAVWPRRAARPVELVSHENVGFTVFPYIHRVTGCIDRLLD